MWLLMRRLFGGLRALRHRDRVEHDLDDELQAYLDAAVERHMQAGLSHSAAMRAARVEIGSRTALKDHVLDAGWESSLESIVRDLRYAARSLRRSPGFALVAIFTLALGIGANTAIFSVVNGLLLRALPVTAPERLAMLSTRETIDEGYSAGWNYTVWKQVHDRQDLVGHSVSWTLFPQRLDLAQSGETDPVEGLFVSGNFFDELGVTMTRGRAFTIQEDVLGGPESQVAVISYGLWERRFGGAADVIGRHITVERVPVTIVGVAPPEFFGPEVGRAFEIALPLGAAPIIHNEKEWGTPAGRSFVGIMLRLKPDQSIASTTAVLRAVQRQIVEGTLRPTESWGDFQDRLVRDPFTLAPAATGESELRRQYSRPLITLLVITGVVLLLACANIANLLLARASARDRELSVRRALGATRWRLAQQVLLESLLLSIIGAALGLAFALWGSRTLVAQLSTWFTHVTLDISLDWRVLIFTSLASIVTAILFGTAPAVRASLAVAGAALADSHRGGGAPGGRLRGSLVMAQVALSVILLVAAGLFIRTFQHIAAVPLGFSSERVLVVDVNASRVPLDSTARPDFYGRMTDAVRSLPGVTHAGASLNTPMNNGVIFVGDFNVLGQKPLADGERRVIVNYITPEWFATYGIDMRQGRVFQPSDTVTTLPVAIVNEAFVRKYFPGRTAIGETVAEVAYTPEWKPTPRTIVGIVSDSVDQSLRDGAYPTIYQPLAQWDAGMPIHPAPSQVSVSVRASSGSPAQLARSVANALTTADPRLAFAFHPLADQVSAGRQQERLIATLSGFFGVLALGLAAIGLYGVTSYAVARRRAEIGIRMALGAQRGHVVRLALHHTLTWSAAGVVLGVAAAAVLTRYIKALLFGVTPVDPVAFIAALTTLAIVVGIATLLPARRAATIDPMLVLRSE